MCTEFKLFWRESCQKKKRNLRLLMWLNSSTDPLFENLVMKILLCSPCFSAYWVVFVSHKHFSLAEELTQPNNTFTGPLSWKSCVCSHLRFIYGESLAINASVCVVHMFVGIHVGYGQHNLPKTSNFHVIFWGVSPLVGLGTFALPMIICVFNFAFSPSVRMLLFSPGSNRPIHI